jgi:hypothetical protein
VRDHRGFAKHLESLCTGDDGNTQRNWVHGADFRVKTAFEFIQEVEQTSSSYPNHCRAAYLKRRDFPNSDSRDYWE